MSEYQYYEFAAIDRPLTGQQMRELRAISTRAEITSRRFKNEYDWGSFKGNPSNMMEKYFDAFLYFANWGTRELMLRFPVGAVDWNTCKEFAVDGAVEVWKTREYLLIAIYAEYEDLEYEFHYDNTVSNFFDARLSVIGGDLGPLYAGWLAAVHQGLVDADVLEPCDPPPLSRGAVDVANFLGVPQSLIDVAFGLETSESSLAISPEQITKWVKKLPPDERDDHLVRLLSENPEAQRARLLKEVRKKQKPPTKANETRKRRMVDALLTQVKLRQPTTEMNEAEADNDPPPKRRRR